MVGSVVSFHLNTLAPVMGIFQSTIEIYQTNDMVSMNSVGGALKENKIKTGVCYHGWEAGSYSSYFWR